MRLALFKCRQAGLDGGDLRSGFGDVQIGRHAIVEAQLRELEAVAGDVEILLGDGTRVLHAAQLDVVLRSVGEHRQKHAATVVFGDFEGGVGGFGFAAHAAPEIQFPRGGETGVPQVEGGIAVVPGRVVQAFAAVAFAPVTAGGGGIRVALGSDDLTCGTALLQATAGQFQVEVAADSALGQGRELRVVEDFPPALVEGLADRLAGGGFGWFCPVGDLRGFGFLEVGADGAGGEASSDYDCGYQSLQIASSRAGSLPQVERIARCGSEPAREGVGSVNSIHR